MSDAELAPCKVSVVFGTIRAAALEKLETSFRELRRREAETRHPPCDWKLAC